MSTSEPVINSALLSMNCPPHLDDVFGWDDDSYSPHVDPSVGSNAEVSNLLTTSRRKSRNARRVSSPERRGVLLDKEETEALRRDQDEEVLRLGNGLGAEESAPRRRIDYAGAADVFEMGQARPVTRYTSALNIFEPFRIRLRDVDLSALGFVLDSAVERLTGENLTSSVAFCPLSPAAMLRQCRNIGKGAASNPVPTQSIYVEGRLYAYGEPLTPPVRSAHSVVRAPGAGFGSHHQLHTLDQWLFFPIPVGELPLDTMLVLTVHGPGLQHETTLAEAAKKSPCVAAAVDDLAAACQTGQSSHVSDTTATALSLLLPKEGTTMGPVGRTAMYVFSSKGRLKTGPRRYRLRLPPPLSGSVPPRPAQDITGWCERLEDPLVQLMKCSDETMCNYFYTPREPMAPWEHLMRLYDAGRLPKVPWLDDASKAVFTRKVQQVQSSVVSLVLNTRPDWLGEACEDETYASMVLAHLLKGCSEEESDEVNGVGRSHDTDAMKYNAEGSPLRKKEDILPTSPPSSREPTADGQFIDASLTTDPKHLVSDLFGRLVIGVEFPCNIAGRLPVFHNSAGEVYHTQQSVAALQRVVAASLPEVKGRKMTVSPSQPLTSPQAQRRQGRMSLPPQAGPSSRATMTSSNPTPSAASSAIAFDASVANYYNLTAVYPKCLVPYHDPQDANDAENVYEAKVNILSKGRASLFGGDEQPGFQQRKRIEVILNRPPICVDALNVDDALLLWQYRRFLSKFPKAFVPFMQSLSWSKESERKEAEKLIPQWRQISPEDALVLLSRLFCMSLSLRKYAIRILSQDTDANLNTYLLQLVQGVRYDHGGELRDFLIGKGTKNWTLASNLYWYVAVENDLEKQCLVNQSTSKSSAPLSEDEINYLQLYGRMRTQFMSELKAINPIFHKRLKKQEDLRKVLTEMYKALFKDGAKDRPKMIAYAKQLIDDKKCGLDKLFGPNTATQALLNAQEVMAGVLSGNKRESSAKRVEKLDESSTGSTGGPSSLSASLREESSTTDHTSRTESLVAKEDSLSVGGPILQRVRSFRAGDMEPTTEETAAKSLHKQLAKEATVVMLPSDPEKAVEGLTSQGVYMFKSAKMPIMLPFIEVKSDNAPKGEAPPPPYKVIYKTGDDVRQDQLVIQFIMLMDTLLKKNGLDLCLTPYRVLATSPNDGFVEVVPDVETFQTVQRNVVGHLQKNNPTPEGMKMAMDKFIKSCAGYCVITFLLGIGDRHLENLLITGDGRLLHIDFGFIFGNDPKPFPPPMKINKEMVEAIGGVQSQGYAQFKSYCCSAYNTLRKHSQLILNLLILMLDSNIPQITGQPEGTSRWLPPGSGGVHSGVGKGGQPGGVDPRVNLLKVQDKLRLDLNDAEATQYIQNVIADSVGAIFTNLWDVIHVAAQAARN